MARYKLKEVKGTTNDILFISQVAQHAEWDEDVIEALEDIDGKVNSNKSVVAVGYGRKQSKIYIYASKKIVSVDRVDKYGDKTSIFSSKDTSSASILQAVEFFTDSLKHKKK